MIVATRQGACHITRQRPPGPAAQAIDRRPSGPDACRSDRLSLQPGSITRCRMILPWSNSHTAVARGTIVPESRAASSRRTPEHCVLSRALRARRGRCPTSDVCVAGTSLEHESRLRITITITNYDYDSRGGMDSSLLTVHRSRGGMDSSLLTVHRSRGGMDSSLFTVHRSPFTIYCPRRRSYLRSRAQRKPTLM